MNFDPRNKVVYSRTKVVNGLHLRLQIVHQSTSSFRYVGSFYLNDQLVAGANASDFFSCLLSLFEVFFDSIKFEVGAYEEFFKD